MIAPTGGRRHGFLVVGTGAIARAHVEAIAQLPSAFVAGVASRTPEGARAFAERHGVRAYAGLAEALEDEAVEVVSVCTPSGAHMEPALAAVRSGRHVVVEKPLEVTVLRARAIVEAAERAGVTLATIFMGRFADAHRRVAEAVASGRLGRLLLGDATVKWYRSQAYYDAAAWRGTWSLDGGGALMNQAIHQLDLLLWIMGPVAEVFAYADTLAHEGLEVEDTLVATLRYANGALGTITAATSLAPGQPKRLEIHGERGTIAVRDERIVAWDLSDADAEEREAVTRSPVGPASGTFADPMAMSFENHRRQLEDVVRAIEEGRPTLVDGREGLRSVEVVEAVYRSVRERRPVLVGA